MMGRNKACMPHCHCERSEESFSDPSQTLRMTQPDVYNYSPPHPSAARTPSPKGEGFFILSNGESNKLFFAVKVKSIII